MITILIADDEKLIRAGLKKILLENLNIPLEILEAKNGQEALELCQKKNPQLLITDIRMPVMDGVELMKKLKDLTKQPAIIVLSGYDEFSYAKAAIQSGALSYILKPLDKKELINTVNSAIMDSIKDEKTENEKKLKEIFQNGRVNPKEKLPEILVKNGLHCITIYGPNAESMLDRVMENKRYYVLESTRNGICIVYPFDGNEVQFNTKILENYIVGVSSSADDYSMLRTLRKQAIIASLQAFFYTDDGFQRKSKNCGIFYYDDIEVTSDFQEIDQNYERMISSCDISTSEDLQIKLLDLFKPFGTLENTDRKKDSFIIPENGKTPSNPGKINAQKLYYLYTKIRSNMFTRYSGYTDSDMYLHLKSIMIESIFDYNNLSEWMGSIRDYIIYLAALLKNDTKQSPYITEALEYIKTHFTKNINMAIVANQVSVNYTWFSEKFKEGTGVNFNEYLKRIRMEEAKKLLKTGLYKVYEVAQRSGFSDVKYFMKQFREETGMSPTEWSKKNKQI